MEDELIPADEEDDDVADKLREMPVGLNDPNVIGDVGPTDVPPGTDPPSPPEPAEEVAEETPL